jgi:hypothetical protein
MLNLKVVACSLGVFTAVMFGLCVLYGIVMPSSVHSPELLETVLPGFKWLTLRGVSVGLLESFIYGALAGAVFTPIYNYFDAKWSSKAKS